MKEESQEESWGEWKNAWFIYDRVLNKILKRMD